MAREARLRLWIVVSYKAVGVSLKQRLMGDDIGSPEWVAAS